MYSDADDKEAGKDSIKGTETGDLPIHVRHLGGGGCFNLESQTRSHWNNFWRLYQWGDATKEPCFPLPQRFGYAKANERLLDVTIASYTCI